MHSQVVAGCLMAFLMGCNVAICEELEDARRDRISFAASISEAGLTQELVEFH